jgi:uncharacterized protein
MSQRIPSIIVGPSILGGRGVFTLEDIPVDTLIEICPVLVIPAEQVAIIHGTVLHDYYFLWNDEATEAAIALGFGSLYNHASAPNAEYEMDFENQNIEIYSLRNIAAGEEITINYNGNPGSREGLWFQVKNA